MSEYELLKNLTEVGIKLGYEGAELREFVQNAQAEERENRQRHREDREKEAERLEREAQRTHELEMERLRRSGGAPVSVTSSHPKPKLPKFDEAVDDLDVYLDRFERYAETHNWPREEWAVNLSPLLSGKALEAYVCLASTDASDYEKVKKEILLRYMMTEEGYRTKFRDTNPEKGETVNQFIARMCRYFDKWVSLSDIDETYAGLKDLILREQFLRKCHLELRTFLKERNPSSLPEMATFTEKYLAAHGGVMFKLAKPRPKGDFKVGDSLETTASPNGTTLSVSRQQALREGKCFLCGQKGHMARNCRPTTAAKDGKLEKLGACLSSTEPEVTLPSGEKVPLIVGLGRISSGLTTHPGLVNEQPVEVLRDTGCTGVVVKKHFVKP